MVPATFTSKLDRPLPEGQEFTPVPYIFIPDPKDISDNELFPFKASLWVYGYVAYLDHLNKMRTPRICR
jgi:hypothetical protein